MDELYEWIRNITFFLIFMTVVTNLLPDKKYEKYLKLFAGMVLILLVMKPFTDGFRLDEKLAYAFTSITFQKEADELKNKLTGMEGARLSGMIAQYEEAVENDMRTMAEGDGFVCRSVQVKIDGEEESERFGKVVSAYLLLAEEASRAPDGPEPIRRVEEVEPISIGTDPESGLDAQGQSGGQGKGANREGVLETNSRVVGLKRRIAEYYDLEETDIEIQLEDREG